MHNVYKIFNNCRWSKGKLVKLPNRQMYKVTLTNNKEMIVTDNHRNNVFGGMKLTKDLTTNDYLMVNSTPCDTYPEVNLPDYKTFTIKSTSIDKICLQIAIIFQFFQDSVDNKTIFLYEVKYEDEFFADLIKSEIKNEDVNQICINVEKYLNSIIKGLDIYNSILINQPFEIVWNIISSPKNFFNVTNKDLLVKMQEDDIIMNSISTLFEKTEDNKLNPIIKLRTDSIYITNDYGKVILMTIQNLVLPNQKMIFSLKKLDDDKSFFTLDIKLIEPVKHQVYLSLKKLWKKRINVFFNYFESLKKKV